MDSSYDQGVISPFAQSPAVDPFYLDAADAVLARYGHGDAVLFAGDPASMVSQTIEPSQLADLFSSPSPEPSPFSYPPSPASSATDYSSSEGSPEPRAKSRRGRKPKSVTPHHHVHADDPYPSGDRVKRHQTKLACSWCRKLSKKCDTQRPCGRCVQFNRCAECVDAPPRKPRAKGVDRGTYKKRDTATPELQVSKSKVRMTVVGGEDDRTVHVKMEEDIGNHVGVAAGTDQGALAPVAGCIAPALLSSPDRSLPFAGPLEDLFMGSATPEMDDLSLSLTPASPSLFDESPTASSLSSPESDCPLLFYDTPSTSDLFVDSDLLVYQALDYYPSIMKILNEYVDAAQQKSFDNDEFQRMSEIALAG